MKFVANRYDVNYRLILADPSPIPGAVLERHPFGLPPSEMRPIWTIQLAKLDEILALVETLGVSLKLSKSEFWSGDNLAAPGERLYGFSLIDDPNYQIDPRDLPIRIVPE